ncbi:Chromosome-partitioning ATPase Soj [compost metagenome]
MPNLSLITGSPHLATMDERLRNVRQPERRLADVVKPLAAQFDVIVIDGPAPPYSRLGFSVALAADELIVPLRAEYLSLESVAQFLRWYRDRHAGAVPLARITGVLLTMVDYRRQATREIVDIIRLHNRRGVFTTEIPPDPRVAEAPSHGIPLVRYAPSSRASLAYHRLTEEILKRARRRRR